MRKPITIAKRVNPSIRNGVQRCENRASLGLNYKSADSSPIETQLFGSLVLQSPRPKVTA